MTDIVRKCIGCNEKHNREEMFRLLKHHISGELILSPTNKDFGRSVYICKNKSCIDNAFKKGKMNRYIKQNRSMELKAELEKLLTL